MKKQWICLILALLLVFAAGCGSAGTTAQTATPAATNAPAQTAEPAQTTPSEPAATAQQPAEATEPAPAEPSGVTADREWLKGKTITIIVGSKAGGNADIMARSIIPFWEKAAGCTFVVDNRPGASGQVAYSYFLALPDKGLETICTVTQTFFSNTIVSNGAEYSIDDISYINAEKMDSPTWTVLDSSPYTTIEELIDAIKANPGKIKVGVNTGGASAIFTSLLIDKLDLDVKVVTYETGAEMRTALLGGHVDFVPGTTAGDLEIGGARPLLVCASERSVTWPDAPCVAEIWPDLDVTGIGSSRGYAVDSKDKAQYPERFQALLETYEEAYNDPEYQAFMEQAGELPISHFYGPEESDAISHSGHLLVEKYADALDKMS